MTLDEIIRDILQVQEFASDSWNKNIINTEEYHRRKNVTVTQAKSAIRKLLLEKMLKKSIFGDGIKYKETPEEEYMKRGFNLAIDEMQKMIEEGL